jgi:hypothetical protein
MRNVPTGYRFLFALSAPPSYLYRSIEYQTTISVWSVVAELGTLFLVCYKDLRYVFCGKEGTRVYRLREGEPGNPRNHYRPSFPIECFPGVIWRFSMHANYTGQMREYKSLSPTSHEADRTKYHRGSEDLFQPHSGTARILVHLRMEVKRHMHKSRVKFLGDAQLNAKSKQREKEKKKKTM